MKLSLFFILLLLFAPMSVYGSEPPADTDYDAGVELLEQGHYLEALKCFGRSANNGNPDAQYQIGIMFLEGEGMNVNPEDAAYWFRKAAQNGHAPSQFEIGNCFLTGTGVQRDDRIAAEWFWRAAEGGDPDGALYVARMYRDGRGVSRNLEKIIDILFMALSRSDRPALSKKEQGISSAA